MIVKYISPSDWIRYDSKAIFDALVEAKARVASLIDLPYQRSWVEKLQAIQLKREVAGTSRIEGAEFTENELEAALSQTSDERFTRSQRQARAAVRTYHWIAPFGNGRTARAVEALMLQRAGLRDAPFIAMSNYYYDEKDAYRAALAEVRQQQHDLTAFLIFGLKGVAI